VLAQAPVDVRPGDTADELHERIKIEERRLLVGTVAALARQGATVTGREVTIP
jgi:phosphoribosylglycinamide formyltransferase-1